MIETFNEIWLTTLFELENGEAIRVRQVILAIGLLLVGSLLSSLLARWVNRRLRRGRIRPDAALVVEKVIFYLLIIVVVLSAMHLVHIPITAFAFLGGAIAIGVGFGAQNIINNFISGWILIAERPVRLGDVVEVDGQHGRVEHIAARCTRIRRTDGIDLLVPNSMLLESVVTNWTLVDDQVRAIVRVGIAYGSNVAQARDLIAAAAAADQRVQNNPAPVIIFEDFGDNALILDLYFWTQANQPMQMRQVCSDLRFAIDKCFAEAGIVIAFPQRDVHLNAPGPITVRLQHPPENTP